MLYEILFLLPLLNYYLAEAAEEAKWTCVSDNKTDHGTGTTVNVREIQFYVPTNCILHPTEGGMYSGKHFWEFSFPENGKQPVNMFVGVTDEKHFQPLFRLRGMYYDANVIDGSSAVIVNFGPRIIGGDKVGVFLDISNSTLLTYFSHNKKPLGLAFKITTSFPTPLYPAISAWKTGKVSIKKLAKIPSELYQKVNTTTGLEGYWKFDNLITNKSKFFSKKRWSNYYIEIEPLDELTYNMTVKLANKFNGLLRIEGEKWSLGPLTSTGLNIPIPFTRQIESYVKSFLKKFKSLSFDEESLTLTAKNGDKFEMRRSVKGLKEPVEENPFE